MATYRGRFIGSGKRFGILVAEFNEFITRRLLAGACEALAQAGVPKSKVDIVWVPGALEIPFFASRLIKKKKLDAVIALACILRGETYHYECVSNEVMRGISQVAIETETPIATGIITADHLEQAIDRAGLKSGNKGKQAALAALEIADLNRQLKVV